MCLQASDNLLAARLGMEVAWSTLVVYHGLSTLVRT